LLELLLLLLLRRRLGLLRCLLGDGRHAALILRWIAHIA
jgi:hypothetical protein